MHIWVPESQVPDCEPACDGQSAFVQQPVPDTQTEAAAHFFMLALQVKSQIVPSHVAVAPSGGRHGSHCAPHVLIELLLTHAPEH